MDLFTGHMTKGKKNKFKATPTTDGDRNNPQLCTHSHNHDSRQVEAAKAKQNLKELAFVESFVESATTSDGGKLNTLTGLLV